MSNSLRAGEYYGTVSNRRSSNASSLIELVHGHGSAIPQHSHERGFFSFLINGSYSETYRGRSFRYEPMTIWWHPPGVLHQDEIGETGGHFFNLEIDAAYIEKFGESLAFPEDFYARNCPLIWSACRLYAEFRRWDADSAMIAESLSLEMLGQAMSTRFREFERQPRWIKCVIEKLNDEFSENHLLESLAYLANVHPVYLASAFKHFSGQTVGDHLRQVRISEAARRLIEGKIPLAAVAADTGFYDQSHLTRVFKRFVGLTPAEFQRACR